MVARNLRVAQAISQVSNLDLAERVGVTHRTVGKWRKAEVDITLGHLAKVASALGRDAAWFLSDHDNEERAA